jgi:putative acetyltransferase
MIREILKDDNQTLAHIIRTSLKSFGLDRPGTVYTDPTTDALFELFQTRGSVYFVATEQGSILGGCGIYPTKGLPDGHAELVKLYLSEEARGKGLGKALMEHSLNWARTVGYTHIYLETFNELNSAVGLYYKLGFKDLAAPMGDSGHHACEVWMLKTL